MPSDNHAQSQAQAQSQPGLAGHRSSSSVHSLTTNSRSTSPPPPQQQQYPKQKGHKHVASTGRMHSRVSSTKGLSKLTKSHANDASHTDVKKLTKNSSATTLKKNSPHANLRRNRSSADVPKRVRDEQLRRPATVHFEIGDQDQDQDDGWEEASSTASPTLSRTASRSASNPSSARPSATNSQPRSPVESQPPRPHAAEVAVDGPRERPQSHSTEGKAITERLLQRTPSLNTTKMSLATATPTSAGYLPDDISKSQDSIANATPKIGSKEEVVSRFVAGSGTPSDGSSPFFHAHVSKPTPTSSDVKRPCSANNLPPQASSSNSIKQDENDINESEPGSALHRSRKPAPAHAYTPPQQSRTQQKLWLQRASSNITPPQLAAGGGAMSDGRPKPQLERTGLEYLVVRRHQDPVGAALRRLRRLPGVPAAVAAAGDSKGGGGSLRERAWPRAKTQVVERQGFDGSEDEVASLLRSVWDKSYDLSASTD